MVAAAAAVAIDDDESSVSPPQPTSFHPSPLTIPVWMDANFK